MVNFWLALHFNLYFVFKTIDYAASSTYKWNSKCEYEVVFVVFLFSEFAKVKKHQIFMFGSSR
jgi:hypothetical protein